MANERFYNNKKIIGSWCGVLMMTNAALVLTGDDPEAGIVMEAQPAAPAVIFNDTCEGAVPPVLPAWLRETVRRFEPLIDRSAADHGLPPDLIAVVMSFESLGHPQVRSYAGAEGLMQVMPDTAAGLMVERQLSGYDGFDPAQNIDMGAYYLGRIWRTSLGARPLDQETVRLLAGGYHSGPNTIVTGQLGPAGRRYSDHVALAWSEIGLPRSQALESWFGLSGPGALEADAATRIVDPCSLAVAPGAIYTP